MVKSFNEKRAVFPAREQRKFLEQVGQKLTIADMAYLSHCSERTIREWRKEKFSMPLNAVQALSTRTHIQIPKDIRIRDSYAHMARASRIGLAVVTKKYGGIPRNEKYRKERWRLWWEKEGKFEKNPLFQTKTVYKPKHSVALAEFVGIMMGDGSISTYQVIITLHHIDDLEYSMFVANLIKKLFKVTPSIYHSVKNSVNDVVVSRKELVQYLHSLGLPIGNKIKQDLDIPAWIQEDDAFAKACLRGLMDTDGCVFTNHYRVNGKRYSYKKIAFSSASPPLIQSVYNKLKQDGFHPRITRSGRNVRLESISDVARYFKIIGTHNPKHLRRYENTVV